jgi:hypothetical protein
MTLPDVIGLILCERMAVDRSKPALSLVGLFVAKTFQRFPTPPQHFTVYAQLYGGSGEGTIALRVYNLETERDIYRHQRWTAWPGPGQPQHHEIRVKKCIFPRPGRYRFVLSFDGQELAACSLDVKLK